ncbi:MAG: intradiol ring-cleavage dioxygenase [Hyphomicrobiales bacterium]|nr:intradiol ring-cleavage dioxygenase [Hyphomicrobiales bacterium]
MSTYLTEENSEDTVIGRIGEDCDSRFRQIMESAVRHLHAFVKDVEPTEAEWAKAIAFLTATGQKCDQNRQEWVLASDVLGVSMLVDAINHRQPTGATENTVLGPFHVEGAPHEEMGANICRDAKGESCVVTGRVVDIDGKPITGAKIDVWSDNADGFYDVQQPGIQPAMNMRGIFTTGADGLYRFRTIRPTSYPLPDDGPVGEILRQLGRHPHRPAHIHFIVSADGYETLTTHIFDAEDSYLDSDAVFGVKPSLIANFVADPTGSARWHVDFDFVMKPAT